MEWGLRVSLFFDWPYPAALSLNKRFVFRAHHSASDEIHPRKYAHNGIKHIGTPRHIIDFIVEIVAPKKTETVLDPACGTAGFLISTYKHILKANTDTKGHSTLTPDEKGRLAQNFKGYDISPDMVRLSLVNMYLHGFTDPHIYEYDTLTSLERWNEHADVILANPPFMSPKGGIKPHNRFSVQSKRSEVLFVDTPSSEPQTAASETGLAPRNPSQLSPVARAGFITPFLRFDVL